MITRMLIPFALLLTAAGCDIIEGPYTENPNNGNGPEAVVTKVLLEEFTGHQCPGCPAGAQVAQQLRQLYGNKFIVIAYHAGYFASPSTSFPADYRTPEGSALRDHFGVSFYPSGAINRTAHSGDLVLDKSLWGEAAASLYPLQPALKLTITHLFNAATMALHVSVTAKSLAMQPPLKLCVFLTENGLISPQKTANDPNYPSGIIPNYEHKHVFRASLNGTWGQSLFPSGAMVNQTETITAAGTLNANWNPSNMSIVCFAYSVPTGQIMQAEEVRIGN